MPGFEPSLRGEKLAVVLDIGTVYTKCGFAGEPSPRFIIPTEVTLPDASKCKFNSLGRNIREQRTFLVSFLQFIYYKRLLVNPKDGRVVFTENVLTTTTKFRNLLADVMFRHFEIQSILFAPSHLITLFTLAVNSGLVVDIGYREAAVLPVFEGHTLLNCWQAAPLGGRAVHENLRSLLLGHASVSGEDGSWLALKEQPSPEKLLTDTLIEDLVVRTCFASPATRAATLIAKLSSTDSVKEEDQSFFQVPVGSEESCGRFLRVPTWCREIAVECLFSGDQDRRTLASLILDSILLAPIDVRRSLVGSIVLIGGTVAIPGLVQRLVEELNACLASLEQFSTLSSAKDQFRIHSPPAEPNYVSWLGGAILGDLEILPGRSLERNTYLDNPVVPDWTLYIKQLTSTDTEVKRATLQ